MASDWKVRAIKAHQERVAEQEARHAYHEEEERRKDAEALRHQLANKLGIDADPTGAEIEIDGVQFSVDRRHRYYLRASVPCPDCEGRRIIQANNLSDVGALLEGKHDYHTHWWDGDSPDAPWNQPGAKERDAATEPSVEERLVGLIREIVREEVS